MFLYSSLLYAFFFLNGIAVGRKDETVEQALDYVFQLQASNCGDLVIGDVLPLQFDVTAWDQYADPAIRTANLLSKVIGLNNGTLDSLTDEMLFLLVRNNVHGDSLIFGACIALERGVYSKYDLFAPYAYKSNNTIRSHDLSVNYFYLHPDREWYNSVKVKDKSNITMATEEVVYRKGYQWLPEVEELYPMASLADGHWTNPYYDCGGGEIWMVTYSAPILKVKDGKAVFQGVATIDIELTYIDINQCDSDESITTSGLDVFRGTHKCQPTTTCVPEKGMGFVPGAYRCVCEDGYFFPWPTSDVNAFTGQEIENFSRYSNNTFEKGKFQCNACEAGCDTCVDASPCLHQRHETLIITLMILNVLTVLGIIVISIGTYCYRNVTVMKAASPIFLELVCLGGVFIYSQFFMNYPEASVITCSIRVWLRHVGFIFIYGSLVLKSWRISMILTIRTQKRFWLPDKALLQRFCILLLLVVAILSAWNINKPPNIETLKTTDGLKFHVCNFSPWQYALIGAEILFLLYGVYLCFTVRNAPAFFNESRHITWAIYNAIILGSVMSLTSRLFVSVIGPDSMLVFEFAQIQVYATLTMIIIFVPKAWAIKSKMEIVANNSAFGINTITGGLVPKEHTGTQTD